MFRTCQSETGPLATLINSHGEGNILHYTIRGRKTHRRPHAPERPVAENPPWRATFAPPRPAKEAAPALGFTPTARPEQEQSGPAGRISTDLAPLRLVHLRPRRTCSLYPGLLGSGSGLAETSSVPDVSRGTQTQARKNSTGRATSSRWPFATAMWTRAPGSITGQPPSGSRSRCTPNTRRSWRARRKTRPAGPARLGDSWAGPPQLNLPSDGRSPTGNLLHRWRRPLALGLSGVLLMWGVKLAFSGPRPPWADKSRTVAMSVRPEKTLRPTRTVELGGTMRVSLASSNAMRPEQPSPDRRDRAAAAESAAASLRVAG